MNKKTSKKSKAKGGRNVAAPKERNLKNLNHKKPRLRDDQIAKALVDTGGFISDTADLLGVTVGAISQRVKSSEMLQQLRIDIEDTYLDIAESKLIKKIREEDTASIFFYLKCKGKKRGYVEKQQTELSGPNNSEVKFAIEFVNPSDKRDNGDRENTDT